MNEKKKKIVKNMLTVSAVLWGIYAILTSLICLLPKFFLSLVFGDILLEEAVQNFYQIGELTASGILFFLCYFLTKKKLSSASIKPTALGILNMIVALFISFIIPAIFAYLSQSYIIQVLLPQSQGAYSCFVATEKFAAFFNPLRFISITLLLCSYAVYWVEVSCSKNAGEW